MKRPLMLLLSLQLQASFETVLYSIIALLLRKNTSYRYKVVVKYDTVYQKHGGGESPKQDCYCVIHDIIAFCMHLLILVVPRHTITVSIQYSQLERRGYSVLTPSILKFRQNNTTTLSIMVAAHSQARYLEKKSCVLINCVSCSKVIYCTVSID